MIRKTILATTLICWISIGYTQTFKLGNLRKSNGYVILYMDIKDTVDFNKNVVGYYFVEDSSFSNTYMAQLYNEYKNNFKDSLFPFMSTKGIKIPCQLKCMGVFRDYLTFYRDIQRQIVNSNKYAAYYQRDSFINDVNESVRNLGDYSNEIWKIFRVARPYLRSNKYLGCLYSIYRIRAEFYTITYDTFEEYEGEFLNTSNDLRERKLIGLQGTSFCAKLEKISTYRKGSYPVFLPVKITQH